MKSFIWNEYKIHFIYMYRIQLQNHPIILGDFFDGPDGSPEFRWNRTKIKGSCTSKVGMAKNRGEPQKMTPSSETENFLGLVSMGKL